MAPKVRMLRAAMWIVGSAMVCLGAGIAHAGDGDAAASAAALRAKYSVLQDQLRNNPFHRPLHLESSESPVGVTGSIHALVAYPFATAGPALNGADRWCDILMLHLNTKYCRASISHQDSVLRVNIGKKHQQSLDEAYRVEFAYRVAVETPGYLKVTLTAAEGPLGTRDYRITLEAVPLDDGRTFIHLTYAYAYGLAGRLAMQAYLGTIGSDKVGFTLAGRKPDGSPLYIDGMRGLVERNTMRYFLAIEAYLGALSASPRERLEKSLRDWFAASERYPLQLHELEQGEYLDMKRNEYSRARGEARLP